jgi:hypothetical protein
MAWGTDNNPGHQDQGKSRTKLAKTRVMNSLSDINPSHTDDASRIAPHLLPLLPPLPIVPNPYGPDLSAAQEASEPTAEEDDVAMREAFSRSCDDEESERDNEAYENSGTNARSGKTRRCAKPSWLPNEYQRLRERGDGSKFVSCAFLL